MQCLGTPGQILAVVTEIVEEQGLRANGLVLECTLDPVVWNGVVDFANGGSMTQDTIIFSTLECPLYANVELLMILVDVSMQTCVGVVDEIAKLVEHVEIDIAKASTVTHSVSVSATVPCPVGNITHDGLCGVKVGPLWSHGHGGEKLMSMVVAPVALLNNSVKESCPRSAMMSSTLTSL